MPWVRYRDHSRASWGTWAWMYVEGTKRDVDSFMRERISEMALSREYGASGQWVIDAPPRSVVLKEIDQLNQKILHLQDLVVKHDALVADGPHMLEDKWEQMRQSRDEVFRYKPRK